MSEVNIVLCWYQSDQWEILKQMATDKEILDDSYEDWRSNANKAIAEIQSQGKNVQKISINVERLVAWCEQEGLENTLATRTQYAVVVAKERDSK